MLMILSSIPYVGALIICYSSMSQFEFAFLRTLYLKQFCDMRCRYLSEDKKNLESLLGFLY
jgi:hypothetical protein